MLPRNVVEGVFNGVGQSTSVDVFGPFNLSFWGVFDATAQLERSFDGGDVWIPCARDAAGTIAAYSAPASLICDEYEIKVKYRLNCTDYVSGAMNYRISQ